MKCKKALGTLAMLTLVATSQLSQAADKTLRIGIEAAYPPFASKTADNQIVGFDYDIGQALCAEMKVTCEWKEVEFDGLIPSLKVRKIDAAISSVSITEDRLKSVDFSRSYYLVPAKLVSRKDNGITAIPRDLKGKRIGVQRATNFERYATDHFVPAGAELVRYGTQNEIYLDFHFVGPSFSEQQYFGTGAGIAIRKQDPLAGELNKALANIRANGTYDQIRKKYFAVDIWSE
jgi:arginine/ornithine transport system substrate-binding protein